MVEVNSETDFVAKNADFQAFVKAVADVIADKNPADVAALLALPFEGGLTVADALRDKILVIGENLSIRRFVRYEGDCGPMSTAAVGSVCWSGSRPTRLQADPMHSKNAARMWRCRLPRSTPLT